jgi:predicted GNAT family N-acyltransferase
MVKATLLGRLAVDQTFRGRRLGEKLLIDGLDRALLAGRTVASAAVVVDARDETSAAFYARYGFIAFPDQPLRLFIAMKTVEQLVDQT